MNYMNICCISYPTLTSLEYSAVSLHWSVVDAISSFPPFSSTAICRKCIKVGTVWNQRLSIREFWWNKLNNSTNINKFLHHQKLSSTHHWKPIQSALCVPLSTKHQLKVTTCMCRLHSKFQGKKFSTRKSRIICIASTVYVSKKIWMAAVPKSTTSTPARLNTNLYQGVKTLQWVNHNLKFAHFSWKTTFQYSLP